MRTHKLAIRLLTFVALAASWHVACGQSLLSEVQRSRWDTQYDAGGRSVRAILTFEGPRGRYEPISQGQYVGQGSLSNVKYLPDAVGVLVTGNWAMSGQTGFFQFNVPSRQQFTGAWNDTQVQRGGYWNGTRLWDQPAMPTQPVQPAWPPATTAPPMCTRDSYSAWQVHPQKGYYYRTCMFPTGGYQYLIYYPNYRPNWVYWFNPTNNLFWCACPTITHPQWGGTIRAGRPLFLLAQVKGASVEQCQFPHPGAAGEHFTQQAQAADVNGSMVNLGTPPEDLP